MAVTPEEQAREALEKCERENNRDPDKLNIGGALLDGFRSGFLMGFAAALREKDEEIAAEAARLEKLTAEASELASMLDERVEKAKEAAHLIRELRSWMHDCGGCHGGACTASCKAAKFFLKHERAEWPGRPGASERAVIEAAKALQA